MRSSTAGLVDLPIVKLIDVPTKRRIIIRLRLLVFCLLFFPIFLRKNSGQLCENVVLNIFDKTEINNANMFLVILSGNLLL